MNEKLLLSVDELTLVLSIDKSSIERIEEWESRAEKIIEEFEQIENIFGEKKRIHSKMPQGYAVAYMYGDNPFYFAVAYHPSHIIMGIIVKYSAYSWSIYCSKSGLNVKSFLHAIQSDLYNFRLTRIDFAVDYQNWNLSVDKIYKNLMNGNLEIQDSNGKKNNSTISAYEIDGAAGTFYVGSKKTGTRLFLRVYDKKTEQIEKSGHRCEEAAYTTSWVRFEAVFKGDYAHQLTDIILETNGENLPDLIADKITEKYRFYDIGSENYTDYTTALIEKSKEDFDKLYLASPRDNDLQGSLLHLVSSSGLFSTLYKCDKIWGDETSTALLKHLYNIYKKYYKPNDDMAIWLKRHEGTLKKQSLDAQIKLLKKIKYSENEDSETRKKETQELKRDISISPKGKNNEGGK